MVKLIAPYFPFLALRVQLRMGDELQFKILRFDAEGRSEQIACADDSTSGRAEFDKAIAAYLSTRVEVRHCNTPIDLHLPKNTDDITGQMESLAELLGMNDPNWTKDGRPKFRF
jgi:hypothetical protein